MTSISVMTGAAVVLLMGGYGTALAAGSDCDDTSNRVHMTLRTTQKPTEFEITSGPTPCAESSAASHAAGTPAAPTSPDGKGTPVNRPGQSWGGKLRKGPGMQFAQVGSLGEGAPLTIVSNAGIRFNEYDWFEVRLPSGKTAFQWGGILCSVEGELPGVFGVCPSR
ncbi:SH3 domain-containing protein [Rhizobium halophytocola]|uniref:Cytoskeletal protein RodZ n=1 Tax=Rhizobium halophytocola TaxID=735519 RepID=A0ABS4DX83_9HYPH|nr:SH3 domain-containing protein [Rhizobium halophytocola]MBP1850280.1 cytoskeletal protein RodZ [Rhizobium halophytocola]